MFSEHCCHLFLISSASVRSVLFLSFIGPIFAWNVPLVSIIFLKRFLVFPTLLFSLHWFLLFLCTDHCGSLSYLFLLLFWTLHSDGYIFPFLLCLLLLFFSSAICKASSDNHFAFFVFPFLGDGPDHCLLYNVTNPCPEFFTHSLKSNSFDSICHFHCIII